MRSGVRKVVVAGALDLGVSEALRELGWRADAAPGASARELSRVIRTQKPRVVHVRESHLPAALVARLSGVPVVFEVADAHLSTRTALAGRLADRVLCGGARLREALVARGAPASSTVVQRGLTPPAPRALPMFPAFLDPAVRWVVCPAPHDHPDRGVPDALLAFAALARTRPRIGLLVNARGVAARALIAQAQAFGLRGRLLVRDLSGDDLRGAFAHAAAVVSASRSASLPDALPEALGAGAAIVATAVGPHPGWIREGRTGFLVPPRAPVALSARLGTLLDEPGLAARLREAARRSAEEAATPRARALELARCYAGVARPAVLGTAVFLPAPLRTRA